MSFEDLLRGIAPIPEGVIEHDPTVDVISESGKALQDLPAINRGTLADFIRKDSRRVRILGLAVGLSQEQLGNALRYHFGTKSYAAVATAHAEELVDALDNLGLITAIEAERRATYSYPDILVERYAPRARAGRAIKRGRGLEDIVEDVVIGLGLPHQMRTTFEGRAGNTAPCDLSLPAGGDEAQIVVGIKGFNSTGSKLTDATRELEQMADVRLPRQFVLAVVDGVGWMSRQSDLKRIWALADSKRIDGLYTASSLAQFGIDVEDAARRLGIEPEP